MRDELRLCDRQLLRIRGVMPSPRPRQPRLRVRQGSPRPPIRWQPSTRSTTTSPQLATGRWRRGLRRVRQLYRTMDWAKHTTVFAAVVAATGLAISAWGTLKSAQVADDQLSQSRESAQEQLRQQAVRVTMWGTKNAVVIANRSLDPVTGVARSYFLSSSSDGTYLGVIPPCSQVSIPLATSQIAHQPELLFLDADGREWAREPNGRLAGPYEPDAFGRTVNLFPREILNAKITGLADDPGARVRSLDSSECD